MRSRSCDQDHMQNCDRNLQDLRDIYLRGPMARTCRGRPPG
jgi:hypothetical protein